MKVRYTSPNKRYNVEFEVTGPKDLFEQQSEFEETVGLHEVCGHCKNANLRLSVRTVDDNKYYEVVCKDCGHRFSFGQKKKDGSLFPKWDKGWHKWEANNTETETDVFDESPKKGKK